MRDHDDVTRCETELVCVLSLCTSLALTNDQPVLPTNRSNTHIPSPTW